MLYCMEAHSNAASHCGEELIIDISMNMQMRTRERVREEGARRVAGARR